MPVFRAREMVELRLRPAAAQEAALRCAAAQPWSHTCARGGGVAAAAAPGRTQRAGPPLRLCAGPAGTS